MSTRDRVLEGWEGPTYQDILAEDPRPIPEPLQEYTPRDLGTAPISASRYTDREFYETEVEKLFSKTWQFACLEAEIPNVGDTYVFELVGKSVLIVRQEDGSIRAFRNVCLHRGRKLVEASGCKRRFQCPYHGFTWGIDGELARIPAGWDFPQIPEDFPLLSVNVSTWAGFVFVNFDENPQPLLKLLDPLPRHMAHWRIEDCYKAVHVGKIVHANWKAVTEAFLEGHHVALTHPQLAAYGMDANNQVDILSDHVTRMVAASGVPGVMAEQPPTYSQEEIMKSMFAGGSRAGKVAALTYEPGTSARRYAADVSRHVLTATIGEDFSDVCDADVLDPIAYDFFPNFHLWGGFSHKISYRFRPVHTDHEKTLMEVFLFKLKPKDENPEPASFRMLSEDESWAASEELGYLGPVYDQDQSNLVPVQKGLRDLGDGPIHLGRYSEARCRNLHRMIDQYLSLE